MVRMMLSSRLLVLPLLALVLVLHLAPAASTASSAAAAGPGRLDCNPVAAAYTGLGLDVLQVQPLPSGAHLRVCPQRATCCSRAMENALLARTRADFLRLVRDQAAPRVEALAAATARLQELLLDIVNTSHTDLDMNLKSIYGYSYIENKQPFTAFFVQLAGYTRGDHSSGTVADMAGALFDNIAARVFVLIMSNYDVNEHYLACVRRQFPALRPLGHMPDRVGQELVQAFVTARRFLLGLTALRDALQLAASPALRLELGAECQRARLIAHYCAWCDGAAAAQPCYNLCANVATGCLASLSPMAQPFDQLVAELLTMADQVEGPSSVYQVLYQFGLRISGGIMDMQERKDALQAEVTKACGPPTLRPGGRPAAGGGVGGFTAGRRRRRSIGAASLASASSVTASAGGGSRPEHRDRLAQLVRSAKQQLRELRGHFTWERLVQTECRLEARPDACWNGTAVAPYLRPRRGATVADLAANPEVSVPESTLTRPAEPVASRLAGLRAGLELASGLPKAGENFRTFREDPLLGASLARLLPAQQMQHGRLLGGSTATTVGSAAAAAALPLTATVGGSGSGVAPPPPAPSSRWPVPPPPVQPLPPLVLSTLAPTRPPPPPPLPPLPPLTPIGETDGVGSGAGGVGSGDDGLPPLPTTVLLPETTTTTTTTTTPTTTTSTTTATTTTSTTTTTTTTPLTTSTTTTTTSPAGPIDSGGSGTGPPGGDDVDDIDDKNVQVTAWPPLPPHVLPSSSTPPVGPSGGVGSGDEESPQRPPQQPSTERPPWLPGLPDASGGRPSGGEEAPQPPELPPPTPRLVEPLPTLPPLPPLPPLPTLRPPQPPPPQPPLHPDLWVPKQPDEQGGAEQDRGEGSVHAPLRMTGSRRACSPGDAAAGRCPACRLAAQPLSIVGLLLLLLARMLF